MQRWSSGERGSPTACCRKDADTPMLASLWANLTANWVRPEEIRAEVWALGGRHRGEALAGAKAELKAVGLSVRRAILLKAVVRSLQRA